MTTIDLQVAPRIGPAYPLGSRFIAWLFLAAGRVLDLLSSRPAPVQRGSDAAQEAQAVRELALEYQRVDPRFAADLFAAADRHERLHGVG
ncbi:MAG: hypothetical protein KF720_08340 [Rubrivivax sp.]|nr:hypothetical protein [Rubrivivax sp.]